MRVVPVLGLVLMLCAGCGGGSGGGAPDVVAPDRAGAPVITAPRDLTARSQRPCDSLLERGQLERLGYPVAGRPGTDVLGSASCSWRVGGSGKRVDVSVVVGRDLFVDSYRRRAFPIFVPLEIGGLPAVDLQYFPSAPTCTTTVGVADGESLDINAAAAVGNGGRPATDPCEEGHRVAEAIVSTLPPK